MLRFLARLLGLLALAAGFASVIIDGTRSIAGSAISLTSLADVAASKLPVLQQAITRTGQPLLWDPVTTSLLRLPVWAALAIIGLALLWSARRPAAQFQRLART